MKYRIIPPFEDVNLPRYSKWSICANDLQIINDMSSLAEAEVCLKILHQIDEEKILSLVLQKFGLSLSQSPFSFSIFKEAFDHFKSK